MRLGFEFAAGVIAARYVAVPPAVAEGGPVKASEKELVTVIAAVALLDGSATLIAVRETPGGDGNMGGAVYVPEESTVPQEAPVQPLPESIQVTARLGAPAEFTAAAKECTAPSSIGADCGETETEMSLVTVTDEVPTSAGFSTLAACTDTEAGAGRFAGAV